MTNLTHDDVQELKRVFDDRYVLQGDCDEIQKGVNRKFSNDMADIKLLQQAQNQNNKLTWGILIGVVCLIVEGVIQSIIQFA